MSKIGTDLGRKWPGLRNGNKKLKSYNDKKSEGRPADERFRGSIRAIKAGNGRLGSAGGPRKMPRVKPLMAKEEADEKIDSSTTLVS